MMSSIGFAKDSAQPSDQQAKVAVENKESAADKKDEKKRHKGS